MIFKQKKWKILITLTVPSCPEVAPKWSPKVTKWSVYGQSKVPTWFSFLPGFDILPQRKHFWLGRCFLWSLAYCLVFFRSYRIYWALWVFKKKCFFVLWMNFCDSGGISVLRVDHLSGIWHIVAFPARQGYTNFTFFCPLHCIPRELQWLEAF